MELAERTCVPCKGGVPALVEGEVKGFLGELESGWEAVLSHHLEKTYRFRNFREALDFTNAVGEVAEKEGHHPEITLTWGRVDLRIWTHKVDGLTESDFVLAAKVDRVFREKYGRRASEPQDARKS